MPRVPAESKCSAHRCPPHQPFVLCLGRAQGVAIEVVEAVVDALMGKLSANAVNAPMVPMEILKELQVGGAGGVRQCVTSSPGSGDLGEWAS